MKTRVRNQENESGTMIPSTGQGHTTWQNQTQTKKEEFLKRALRFAVFLDPLKHVMLISFCLTFSLVVGWPQVVGKSPSSHSYLKTTWVFFFSFLGWYLELKITTGDVQSFQSLCIKLSIFWSKKQSPEICSIFHLSETEIPIPLTSKLLSTSRVHAC